MLGRQSCSRNFLKGKSGSCLLVIELQFVGFAEVTIRTVPPHVAVRHRIIVQPCGFMLGRDCRIDMYEALGLSRHLQS